MLLTLVFLTCLACVPLHGAPVLKTERAAALPGGDTSLSHAATTSSPSVLAVPESSVQGGDSNLEPFEQSLSSAINKDDSNKDHYDDDDDDDDEDAFLVDAHDPEGTDFSYSHSPSSLEADRSLAETSSSPDTDWGNPSDYGLATSGAETVARQHSTSHFSWDPKNEMQSRGRARANFPDLSRSHGASLRAGRGSVVQLAASDTHRGGPTRSESRAGALRAQLGSHHLRKRSFDSIAHSPGVAGLEQNFLGHVTTRARQRMPAYNHLVAGFYNPIWKRRADVSEGEDSGEMYTDWADDFKEQDEDREDKNNTPEENGDKNLGLVQEGEDEENGSDQTNPAVYSGHFRHGHNQRPDLDSVSQIDLDFPDVRTTGSLRNILTKRQLDSISRSPIGGMEQNFLDKRRGEMTVGQFVDILRDVLRNYGALPRDWTAPRARLGPSYPGKRGFDSINDGTFHGMEQNFLPKRVRPPYLTYGDVIRMTRPFAAGTSYFGSRLGRPAYTGAVWPDHLKQLSANRRLNEVWKELSPTNKFVHTQRPTNWKGRQQKRTFDSIGEGNMQGMEQNFLSKRTFDSISRSLFHGIEQNYLGDKRAYGSFNDQGFLGMGRNLFSG
ncbi:uncharacterized protein LOC101848122 isoform X2 [Aplysia californica]|uniref:Uncharacterized protein LOC101848122 isoform X2 n=1 Tax=Aplysia californica TaxID=6500 RepID=A0ABM1VVB9_APLCA|nr:uncharacterized protein LOC101848122 isoform X2 [Aplysia californica]